MPISARVPPVGDLCSFLRTGGGCVLRWIRRRLRIASPSLFFIGLATGDTRRWSRAEWDVLERLRQEGDEC